MNTLTRENRDADRAHTEQFIVPPSSVIEGSDGYTLEVEMPGVNKDGLDISIENNELTIHRAAFASQNRGNADSSRIAPRKFPAHIRAGPIDRRRQNQRQNRAGPCDVDFAQSGARQAAQDHCFLTVSFASSLSRERRKFAAFFFLLQSKLCLLFYLANRCQSRTTGILIWRQKPTKKQPLTN